MVRGVLVEGGVWKGSIMVRDVLVEAGVCKSESKCSIITLLATSYGHPLVHSRLSVVGCLHGLCLTSKPTAATIPKILDLEYADMAKFVPEFGPFNH